MSATYRLDARGLEENVLCAEWMKAEMGRRAAAVMALAVARAPFDIKDSDGVHYKDCFELEVGIKDAVGAYGPTRRACGTVRNTDMPTALFVEYGFKGGVDKDGRTYPAFEERRILGGSLDAASL